MTFSGFGYTCSAGETFDSVSLAVYGDEKYAADILCMNPELSSIPIFSGGEMLRLPVVEIPDGDPQAEDYMPVTPPWKEGD